MEGTGARTDSTVAEAEATREVPRRRFLVEPILDNLAAWAFIALVVAALFMVWATIVIVETYVGELPSFEP